MNIKKIVFGTGILGTIKVLTMVSGLVQSIVLAHFLSVDNYALYGQCNTLIATVSGVTIFGFADSVLFFCGIAKDDFSRRKYLTVIFIFEILFCIISGVLLLALKNVIVEIFNNNQLGNLVFLLALFPLFTNLSNCLSQLLFTEHKVKAIGIANLLFSLSSLAIAFLIINDNSPIVLFLYLMLVNYFILIVLQIICYLFEKKRFIKFLRFDTSIVRQVLKYALPLGVSIIGSTLLKEFDKIIISNQCSSLDFATYTAVSRQLPVTFFSAALSSQIIPLLVKAISEKDMDRTKKILHIYYVVGFVSSMILGFAILSVSKQFMLFLYSDKYSEGIWVFIIYVFVDIVSFAYPGQMLLVSGRTKELLFHSIIMVVANIILNIILLNLFGILGPAVATLIVQICALCIQTYRGMKLNNIQPSIFVPWKHLIICTLLCVPMTVGFGILSHYYSFGNLPDILVYGVACGLLCITGCGFYLFKNKVLVLKGDL